MTTLPEMLTVQVRTDEDPGLADLIAERERTGQSRFDEWWEGVYRIVTGPRINHGQLVVRLSALLLPACDERELTFASPVNIGVDKWDARVPDMAVLKRDVAMTSPAFASTAELVIEILSPREIAGEKLPFYRKWNVKEYLEIDLPNGTCRLLANSAGQWQPIETSDVLGFELASIQALLDD